VLFAAFLLVGCEGILAPLGTPTPQVTPQATQTELPTQQAALETPAQTATPPGPVTLRIWVPPQFDPTQQTLAGELMRSRIAEFSSRRPSVRVEVRVKAVDGPGGLLDSLTTASAAAPLALPDLVALPRPLQETAALKGLLHPYDNLTAALDDPDWYEFARQLALLQSSTFGLPFAGDVLVVVYHPLAIESAPASWPEALNLSSPLAFSAADPQALFTLGLYQSAGGAVRDDQGRPVLETNPLTAVLTFYQEAEKHGLMPVWLTQIQNDDQVWEAMQDGRADMAVTWASRFLEETPADSAIAPIPTAEGKLYTLATGWVWALASPQPERQEISVQLAEFLTESGFLARWSQAAGYLPPRPSALSAWSDSDLQSVLNQIALSAQLYPSADVLTSLGPPLGDATVQVLKQQTDPLSAAQVAVESLKTP
jgi:multiple sugar transport system substrate-binding protein